MKGTENADAGVEGALDAGCPWCENENGNGLRTEPWGTGWQG